MKQRILITLFLTCNFSNCIVTEFYEREVVRDALKKYGEMGSEFEKKYILPGYEVRNEKEGTKFLFIDGAFKEKQANRILKIKMDTNGITDMELEEVKTMPNSGKISYLIDDFSWHMWKISNSNFDHLPKWQRESLQESIPANIRNLITQKPINLLYYYCADLEVGCKVESFLVKKNGKGEVTVIQKEEFTITKSEIKHLKSNRFIYFLTQAGFLVTVPIDFITFPLQAGVYVLKGVWEIGDFIISCMKGERCLAGISGSG